MNPTPIDPQYAGMMLIVGIGFLVNILVGISTMISQNKRKPALDQEVYRDFVRRQELEIMRAQFVDQVRSLDDRHQKTAAEIFNVLRLLKDDIGKQSTHIETSLNAVASHIGELRGSIQTHLQAEKRAQ
jgi:hypothetical protein